MGYQSRAMTAYIPIMIGVLLVTPCSFSRNLNCTRLTTSCPTAAQWSERGKLFNCPGNKKYVCLMAPGKELREGCMFNSTIEAGQIGCPYTKQCDTRTGQPVLVTPNYYLTCPPESDGCPPRSHSGYSIFEIYKYPRCQEGNTYEESSVSPDEVTGTQTTIVPDEILQYPNWKLIILCIALGLFTSFIVICFVFKEKVWKKQCWRRHTHPASFDDSESAQTLLLPYMRQETSQLSHNKPYPEPVSNISDQDSQLLNAASNGDIERVKELIHANADVNARGFFLVTPLHETASNGHSEIMRILIIAKADVNAKDWYQETPLHKAIKTGRIDIVKILIEAKADVNAKDEYQGTPLHKATEKGRIDIVKILIEAKANVNTTGKYQGTPLHKATENGRIDIVKILIGAKADVNAKDEDQDTPLHRATVNGRIDIVKILIDAKAGVNVKDMDQGTPLHKATGNGRIDIVKILMDAKADVNAKDKCQCTPLHMAASNGHSDIVKILTDAKANVNAMDLYQHTPLHMAVSNGHIDTVKMLFNAKADVNAKDSDQDTPLHKAASNGHSNLVKMLIDAQAEVNAKGCNEKTPLHLAVESEKTCIIKKLLDEGADVNAEDKNKKTPLSLAEDCGKPDIIKEFPDVILNQNNTNNKTPLSLAENCGKADIRKELPDLVNDNEKKKLEILFHVQLLKKHRYCPDSEGFIVEEARKHFNILNMMICTEYGGEERLVLIGYKSPQDEFRCEQTDFHGITVVIKNLYDVDKTPFKVAHHSSRSKHEIDVDLIKCVISENADRLWKEHSNLSIITGDKLKLVSGEIQPQQCVVLYCLSKGFIPLGEKMFPKELSCSKGGTVAVDVREGIFSLGPSLRGKTLCWNDMLCMGCNIGREDMSAFGSLGLFIRQNGQREPLWFLTCCHVLFDCIRDDQFRYDRSNSKTLHTVLQPYTDAFCSRDVRRCGVIERAVFQPNVDPVSVDAALVLITDRAPSTGYFAIKDKQQEKEAGMEESPIFNSGEISESIKDTDRFNPVIKSGTSTGLTTSQFGLDGMQCRLFDGMRLGSKNSAPLVMKGQYEIEAKSSDNPFFTKGDSGSAVFMMDANCKLNCIGLAIGNTSYGTTAVTPIGEILKKLNLRNADVAKF